MGAQQAQQLAAQHAHLQQQQAQLNQVNAQTTPQTGGAPTTPAGGSNTALTTALLSALPGSPGGMAQNQNLSQIQQQHQMVAQQQALAQMGLAGQQAQVQAAQAQAQASSG